MKPILESIGKHKLADIKPGDIRSLAKRLYPEAGPATWNRQVITPARAVINHAHDKGWCPPMRVKKFKEPKPKKKAVSIEWIITYCENADPYSSAAMMFMFTTGARIGEVVELTPDHFDISRKVAYLEKTKTGEPRNFYLTEEMVNMILDLEPRYNRVFGFSHKDGLRKAIKRNCESIGLEYVPPHQAGRHSFATELIVRQKMDPVTTAMIGGWKSPRVLLDTYSHAENLGEIVESRLGSNLSQNNKGKLKYIKNQRVK